MDRPNRVVTRDPALADNRLLPQRLQAEVGRIAYQKLREGFRGESFDCPPPLEPSASSDAMLAGVRSILKTFVSNGYALNARVADVDERAGRACSWTMRMEGAASLWGTQALRARRALLTDSFDAFAVLGFLDASGWDGSFRVTDVGGTYVEEAWTASPRAAAV